MSDPTKPLFALDFDRCLGDVQALYGLLESVIEEQGVMSKQQLMQARREVEISGGSFDALTYIAQHKGPDSVAQLLKAYQARNCKDANFLLPGAAELFEYLKSKELRYFIITYGGENWQRAKIARSGITNVPVVVVDSSQKGSVLASWYDDRSLSFQLPGYPQYQAPSIVLVDDKAAAFSGLPAAPLARGYWLKSADLLPSQAGEVPENVRIIKSLGEIVNFE